MFGTRFSDEECDTIGGLVLHELGRMPRRGEAVEIGRARAQGTARRPAAHRDAARDDAARLRAEGRSELRAGPQPAAARGRHSLHGGRAGLVWRRGRWIALTAGFVPRGVRAAGCRRARCRLSGDAFSLWHGTTPREAAWRGFLFTGGLFSPARTGCITASHEIGTRRCLVRCPPDARRWSGSWRRTPRRSASLIAGCACAGAAALDACCCPRGWALSSGSAAGCSAGFRGSHSVTASSKRRCAGMRPSIGVYGVSLAAVLLRGPIVTMLLGARRARWIAR